MPDAILLSPLLVAGVLLMSGVAKLRHPGSDRDAFEALQVPAFLAAPWMMAALPYAEIALALGLLLTQGWVLLGIAALAALLCAGYWVLIARAVVAKRKVSCNCFGQLTTGTVGPWTLARNSVLLLVALLAVADAALLRDVAILRIAALEPGQAWWFAGAVVTAALVALVIYEPPAAPVQPVALAAPASAALASAGSGSTALAPAVAAADSDELEYVRHPIPEVSLTDADGNLVPLRELVRDRAVVLVWLSFTCAACGEVMTRLTGWADWIPQIEFRPVVADLAMLARRAPELSALGGLSDPGSYVQAVLGESAVPMAVVLGADGLLAGGPVLGLAAISEIVNDIADRFDIPKTEAVHEHVH
ncbi:MAG: MauE/DoxX family redox-associated membrane protein [Propionicimonas sp.]